MNKRSIRVLPLLAVAGVLLFAVGTLRAQCSEDAPVLPAGCSCAGIQAGDDVIDVRKCGAAGSGLVDDTLPLKCAAYYAAGKTLWIPAGYTFRVDGSDGVRIWSRTHVTGGGTLKHPANTTSFRLLQIEDSVDVSVSDLTFDGNAANQPTPTCLNYPGEYHHAIGVLNACRLRVSGCIFKDLTGDGMNVAHSSQVLVQESRFTSNYTSRNGIAAGDVHNVKIQGNYFEGQGRECMPGAIDLEIGEIPTDVDEDIVITGNEFWNPEGQDCDTVVGVGVSNHDPQSLHRNIVVSNNAFRGCFAHGILVASNGAAGERAVVVTGNSLSGIRNGQGERLMTNGIVLASWDVYDAGHPCGAGFPGPRKPATALVSGNSVEGAVNGIAVYDSDALVRGNYVVDVENWGIRYSTQCAPGYHGEVTDNRLVDCGEGTGDSGGIEYWGSNGVISGNHVLASDSSHTELGIYLEAGTGNLVEGNVLNGIDGSGFRSIVVVDAPNILTNNRYSTSSASGEASIYGTYPPGAGTGNWKKGTIVYDPNPQLGGTIGWVCTASGDPATWSSFGPIGTSQFATLTGSQTLTNKNLSDASNTFPPFVTVGGVQTLTNKNLTDPTNTLPATPHALALRVQDSSAAASPSAIEWTNMPSATTELYGNAVRRTKVDLSAFTQFRLEAVQSAAGASGAKLRAEYSTNQTTWLDLASSAGAGDVAVATGGSPAINLGSFTSIASGGRADVYVRIVGTGGNGTADPSWYAVRIQLK